MIDETRIRDWLARYDRAWSSDERELVERLFTDDAVYHTAPYADPLRGVEQVAAYWLGEREWEIPWVIEYQVLAQEEDLFVVRAVTTYPEGTHGAEREEVFHNLWLVRLDGDRAREFVEYFMPVP
jgi:hypothetical protein